MRSASIPGGARSAMVRRMSRRWRRYVEERWGAGFPKVAGVVTKSLRPCETGACASGMSMSMSMAVEGCGVVLPSDKSGSPTPASAWSDTPDRRRSVLDGGSRFDAAVCGGVHGVPCSAGGAQVGEDGWYGAEGDWGRGGDGGVDPGFGGNAAQSIGGPGLCAAARDVILARMCAQARAKIVADSSVAAAVPVAVVEASAESRAAAGAEGSSTGVAVG
jgi:hypothetical protein